MGVWMLLLCGSPHSNLGLHRLQATPGVKTAKDMWTSTKGNTVRQIMDGLWTEARGQQKQSNDPGNQHNLNTPTLGATDAQTTHHATSSTAPTHQVLGSANAETTPARAPAAAANRKKQPDATCAGKNG